MVWLSSRFVILLLKEAAALATGCQGLSWTATAVPDHLLPSNTGYSQRFCHLGGLLRIHRPQSDLYCAARNAFATWP